ncbi:UNVERIFIED_CONTAM: hypothetical protein K2H54_002308 [Gekko kuhli]
MLTGSTPHSPAAQIPLPAWHRPCRLLAPGKALSSIQSPLEVNPEGQGGASRLPHHHHHHPCKQGARMKTCGSWHGGIAGQPGREVPSDPSFALGWPQGTRARPVLSQGSGAPEKGHSLQGHS